MLSQNRYKILGYDFEEDENPKNKINTGKHDWYNDISACNSIWNHFCAKKKPHFFYRHASTVHGSIGKLCYQVLNLTKRVLSPSDMCHGQVVFILITYLHTIQLYSFRLPYSFIWNVKTFDNEINATLIYYMTL